MGHFGDAKEIEYPEWSDRLTYMIDTIDCVEWDRARNTLGYGVTAVRGRLTLVHRTVWEETYGAIPPKMCVCHKCDNPPCINVDHLFLGTVADNMRDKILKGHQATCSRPKLTGDIVIEIRRLSARGMNRKSIGARFGVCENAVYNIIARRTWRHVE